MSIKSINPNNNELLKEYEHLSKPEVLAAVDAAHQAYLEWRKSSFSTRRKNLLKFADSLIDQKEDLSNLITLEMGKRLSEAKAEIEFCAEITRFYANGAEEFLADQPIADTNAEAYISHQPIGVLLGIMPWNFPFYQVIRFATPNIMAGNTVMVKHASNVPQCAEKIADLFAACGIPENVFTNLFIPYEFAETIIESKHIRGVSLTGSEKAGAVTAATAGKNLKRSVLELGGNDAFIVLDDADLDQVVPLAIKGRMVNNGQSCVAAKRFIVDQKLARGFKERLTAEFAKLRLGDPMLESTDLGPLSSEAAAQNLLEQVEQTVAAGAELLIGGKRPKRAGAFFEPTILCGVTKEMPSYDQELFGPVATVYTVEDEQAAINLANDSSYGLGGSVYTSDPERGKRVAEQIETGMVFINQPTNSQASLPFGGIKNSGYGRELSHLGIMEFINKKLIHLDSE